LTQCLDLGPFRQLEGVFDVNAKIADGALELRMTEKALNCAEIPVAL
jgi:hypothetical protein